MKLSLVIEITEQEAQTISENALERVLSNAIRVGKHGAVNFTNELQSERASILKDDCETLKPIVSRIWRDVQNAIFVECNK